MYSLKVLANFVDMVVTAKYFLKEETFGLLYCKFGSLWFTRRIFMVIVPFCLHKAISFKVSIWERLYHHGDGGKRKKKSRGRRRERKLTCTECLLCVRFYTKHYKCLALFNPHNNSRRLLLFKYPVFRREGGIQRSQVTRSKLHSKWDSQNSK